MTAASRSSILLVGATGNTGPATVRWLSRSHATNPNAPRILAVTRDVNSAISTELARLPHVEMTQKLWTEIDAEWLLENHVARVFIAHHNPPTQFEDESGFLVACRDAKVQYLVKLSTSPPFLTASSRMQHARSHWAAEQMLRANDFDSLPSTILRPNAFLNSFLDFFLGSVKAAHESATSQDTPPIGMLLAEHATAAPINPEEVGEAAGALLALPDPSAHFGRTYSLSGPADVSAVEIVRAVEAKIGRKLTVAYESEELLKQLLSMLPAPLAHSTKVATTEYLNKGRMSIQHEPLNTTSPEILELGISRMTVQEYIDSWF